MATHKIQKAGTEQLTLRVPTELIEQAKRGSAKLSRGDNPIAQGLPIYYTTIIRMAIERGLPLVLADGERKR